MKHAVVETLLGAVVLGLAIWFGVHTLSGRGMHDTQGSYRVKAAFNDITGVGIGSDVRIGGVKIGTVERITLDPQSYQADVSLLIGNKVALPVDSDASIVGESLLGGKFVALTPGGADDMLTDGGVIEFTQSSISLEQLLGKFVFSAGGVDEDNASDDDELGELGL